MTWSSKPENAWMKHILPFISTPGWLEDSNKISDTIQISKRELFALIALAHLLNNGSGKWRVGFDPNDGDRQNDGHVIKGGKKILVEHKMVAQIDKREVLDAILATYDANARKGDQYGKSRILVIHPNKHLTVA